MKRWFKLILLIWLIIPISCEALYDDGDKPIPCNSENAYTPIESIQLDVGSINDKGYFDTTNSTDENIAALLFTTQLQEVAYQLPKRNSFSFLTKSYATPPCGTIYSSNYLDSISITSSGAVETSDSSYSPGAGLKELFKVQSFNNFSIKMFEREFALDSTSFGVTNRFGYPGFSFIFQCSPKVRLLKNQTLFFLFVLDDGRTIKASTNEFEIK